MQYVGYQQWWQGGNLLTLSSVSPTLFLSCYTAPGLFRFVEITLFVMLHGTWFIQVCRDHSFCHVTRHLVYSGLSKLGRRVATPYPRLSLTTVNTKQSKILTDL